LSATESDRQGQIDAENADFWDELCGSGLARSIGVTDASERSLQIFDRAYLDLYPYLDRYLPASLNGERLLEIGLGYGTVGGLLAERGADYHGLDIAQGPVEMMRERLRRQGVDRPEDKVTKGSALEIPHGDGEFDRVVSIGCLHHTGDLRQAITEVHRVLRPGGTAMVMLYNSHSFRQLALRVRRRADATSLRRAYDSNEVGEAAPSTEFVSRSDVRELFGAFDSVSMRAENFDDYALLRGRLRLPRRWFLRGPAQLAGLDLYITARR
jgi:ubiquinone/menaquinone biosynthesis C-methylase UbiE